MDELEGLINNGRLDEFTEMESFKIDTSDHVRPLKSLLLVIVIFSIGIYFLMIYKYGSFDLQKGLIVGVITLSLFVLPMLILHLQYYFQNRHDKFEYDQLSGEIVYQRGDSKLTFRVEEILKITVHKSRPLAEGRTPILIWDEYNYAVIELKDGQKIKLSSLLVNELDKVLKFENTEIKKTLYAWIR
jgi:hypothetical protein